jgi:hypothetical protein
VRRRQGANDIGKATSGRRSGEAVKKKMAKLETTSAAREVQAVQAVAVMAAEMVVRAVQEGNGDRGARLDWVWLARLGAAGPERRAGSAEQDTRGGDTERMT